MTTEMITFKLEDTFLKDVDSVVKNQGFHSRTEFIRNALREKVEEAKLKEAMIQIAKLKGSSNNNTSDKKLEEIRNKVFEEFEKNLK
ncbi:hypothetical protein HOD20_00335 [archaeon]|jgi:metal-responsive CopG/Arc/MetJ family transcriptional regulator|nr:hypothetical protein [archaeon]MBT4350949.1 hypothetical protein [archaeon]MBT4647634.1 hypothetical protein [archaeon]MBT6822610.1 hypothetical protein [archaeon]MBT7392795.1 hypothetical protein [archaeon]